MPPLITTSSSSSSSSCPKGHSLPSARGYNNYKQFAAFTVNKIYFIARQKDNAVYKTINEKILTGATPDAGLKEETIEESCKDVDGETKVPQLRRIAWWDVKGSRVYEFASDNFELVA